MATLKDLLVSGPARVIGNITGKSFIKEGGTSSQFLKADGSVDSSSYSLSNHTHTLSVETSNDASQITLTHNTKFKISAGGSSYVFTTPSLPFASNTVTGITKLGAAGGAATFDHGHGTIKNDGAVSTNTAIQNGDRLVITDTSDGDKIKGTSITFGSSTTTYLRNDGTWGTPSGGSGGGSTVSADNITLSKSAQAYITVDGNSKTIKLPDVCPWDIDTNTTYTIATGDANGQIKVTPSSGNAYNVSVKGLGSAAYTESSAYATSTHTHGSISNAGAVSTNTAIQSGDRLLITDTSDSNKIKGTSITFGTSTSTYLRNDGTWGTPSGGSGGGSTVSANNITLSTSDQTYVTVNGTSKTIKLPDYCPWDVDVPLATPMFDGDEKGSVIPIAKVTNSVVINGAVKAQYETSPILMFPINIEGQEAYALPVYMDVNGHLFILLSQPFAEFLRSYDYGTSSEP